MMCVYIKIFSADEIKLRCMITFVLSGDASSICLKTNLSCCLWEIKNFSNVLTCCQDNTPGVCLLCNCRWMCMCRSQRWSYSSGEAWWLSAWRSTPRLHAPNPITGSWCGLCPGARPRTCTAATVVHRSCPRSLKTAGVRGTRWTCTQSFCSLPCLA